MKELHKLLKVFIFVQLGSCSATVLKEYFDFVNNSELYITYSAPWYAGIKLTLILTAVTISLTTIAYFVVGKIIKKRQQEQTDTE